MKHPKADEKKRAMFKGRMDKYQKEGSTIVYINGSGFADDMPRMHGYSNIGERCYGTHDWHAKGRKNMITGLLGESLSIFM